MIETITARRVSSLTSAELNALIDQHLFNHRPLCLGHSEPDALGVYRCVWCGEIDDRAVASRIFDMQPWHRRVASQYTPEQIVMEMQRQSETAQIVFATTAKALILGPFVGRSALTEFMQILFNVHNNVRAVSIAALTALKVVDEQGFVREG
jgi:hypothetical protein